MTIATTTLLFSVLAHCPSPPLTTLQPLFVSEIARDAQAILIGTVSSSDCRYANGKDTIRTHVTLRDVVVCRGVAPPNNALQFEGGRIGDDRLMVPGMPQLELGKRYLLCVAGNGSRPSPIVGFAQGLFEISQSRGREVLKTIRGLEVIGVRDDRLVLAGTTEVVATATPGPGDATPIVLPPSQDHGERLDARALIAALTAKH